MTHGQDSTVARWDTPVELFSSREHKVSLQCGQHLLQPGWIMSPGFTVNIRGLHKKTTKFLYSVFTRTEEVPKSKNRFGSLATTDGNFFSRAMEHVGCSCQLVKIPMVHHLHHSFYGSGFSTPHSIVTVGKECRIWNLCSLYLQSAVNILWHFMRTQSRLKEVFSAFFGSLSVVAY